MTLRQVVRDFPPNTTHIILEERSLTGYIPDDLALHFPNLTVLILSSNKLEGPIPEGLCLAAKLERLDLFENRLSGMLPTCIGKWTKLRSIELANNAFFGPLPSAVQAWESLIRIDVGFNGFSGELPSGVGSWRHVEEVWMGVNKFSGAIPTAVENWTKVTHIGLGPGLFSGSIPAAVGSWRRVQLVDIYQCQLTGTIPAEVGNWLDVREVYLESNKLTGRIPPEVGNWSKVEAVYLNSNHLTGEIPPEVGSWTGVKLVQLFDNHLSGSIPPEVGNWTEIMQFRARNNHLSGSIPPEAGKWTKVKGLDLLNNRLTGSIPEEVGNWSLVENVYLRNNSLSGQVPPGVGAWSKVVSLDLSNNGFGLLPGELGGMEALKELLLNNNRLAGLPNMSGIRSLERLSAQNNAIRAVGLLPAGLQELDLSGNELASLPEATYNLSELKVLLLSSNKISSWPAKGVFRDVDDEPPYEGKMNPDSRVVLCGIPMVQQRFGFTKLARLDVANNPLNVSARGFLDSLGYLQSLSDLSCRRCGLQGRLAEQGKEGLADDQLSTGDDECIGTDQPRVGFTGLLSLNLADNFITEIEAEPSPSLMFVDLSGNALTKLDPLWFNSNGEQRVFELKLHSNPDFRVEVQQPTARCRKSGSLALVADPEGYKGQAPGHECTSLCPGLLTKYVHDSALDILSLCRCTGGYGGRGKNCSICPKDSYSSFNASEDPYQLNRECRRCPEGSVTDGPGKLDISACECPAGTFLDAAAGGCQLCEQWPFRSTRDKGEVQASACTCNASYTGLKEANGFCGCDDGWHMNRATLACEKCSNAEICFWGTELNRSLLPPKVKAGFWAEPVEDLRAFAKNSVWRCSSKETCTVGGECAPGRSSRACGLCQSRMHGQPDGPCEACSSRFSAWTQGWLQVLGILFFLVPCVILVHVGLVARGRDMVLVMELRAFRSSVKQTVKHLQNVSVIGGFSVSWPPLARAFFDALGSVSVPSILPVSCMTEQTSASLEMYAKWAMPIAIVLVTVLAVPVSWVAGRVAVRLSRRCKESWLASKLPLSQLPSPSDVPMSAPDVARVLLFSVMLFWSTLVANSLEIITCIPSPNGQLTVATYPHIRCSSGDGEFLKLSLLAAVTIVFYLCIPLRVLYKGYLASNMVLVSTNCADRGWYGFIFADFRDGHMIWTLLIMVKDALYAVIPAALPGLGAFQLLLTAALTCLHTCLVVHYSPFSYRSNSLLEAWNGATAAALCFYSCGMGFESTCGMDDIVELFQEGAEDPMYRGRATGMVIVQVVALAIPASMLLFQLLRAFKRSRKLLPKKVLAPSEEEFQDWVDDFASRTNLDNLVQIVKRFDDADRYVFRTLFEQTLATMGERISEMSSCSLVQRAGSWNPSLNSSLQRNSWNASLQSWNPAWDKFKDCNLSALEQGTGSLEPRVNTEGTASLEPHVNTKGTASVELIVNAEGAAPTEPNRSEEASILGSL